MGKKQLSMWEFVLKDLRLLCEMGCRDLEEKIAIWEKNPDDPECAFIQKALEKGELEMFTKVMLADPALFRTSGDPLVDHEE